MNISSAMLAAGTILAAALIAWVVDLVRNDRLPRGILLVLGSLSALGLVAMVISDLDDVASQYWSDHSVASAILSSLLLVGTVYIFYENNEQQRQDAMVTGLSGAGVGGIVDHMIDLEIALALLSQDKEPPALHPIWWKDWLDGKPLRWLRNGRGELTKKDAHDPRTMAVAARADCALGGELIDQCVRRLLAAMRDWTPLISASTAGTEALLLLSHVRVELMQLQANYQPGCTDSAILVGQIRNKLRVLALCFEDWSFGDSVAENNSFRRPEIMFTAAPGAPEEPHFPSVDNRELSEKLESASAQIGFS
ncbi:hypothetical protein ABLE94_04630 [Gordonia sp. VNK1]|uniref:hypothetical protein n=1 Tax=Gordonia oleivorans TaxID=3156618 RepID=UPI0032B618A6